MNNEKRVVLLSLTILALLLTGFTWAYWNDGEVKGVHKDLSNTIEIGAGDDVSINPIVNITVNDAFKGKKLVPSGYEDGINTVSEIDLNYNLLWKEETLKSKEKAKGLIGFYTVDLIDFDIEVDENTAPDYKELFKIEVKQGSNNRLSLGTLRQDAFTVTVKFNREPADQYEYQEIINKELKINLAVKVEKTN